MPALPYLFSCQHLRCLAFLALIHFSTQAGMGNVSSASLTSPDRRIAVDFHWATDGSPRYAVRFDGHLVILDSKLGLIADDGDFSQGLTLTGESPIEPVDDHYEILTAKRRINDYRANRRVFHLAAAGGQKMDLIFQVSNDGIAFRYFFPDAAEKVRTIKQEVSSFHLPPEAEAWLQPMSVAKTGFEHSNPAYEEYYAKEIPVGTPSTLGAGWVYPALFRVGETWLLVSEGSLPRTWCATHLQHESPGGEYSISFPDSRETMNGLPINPSSKLPWYTPWRLIAIGNLKTLAESTLGIDLAEKPALPADFTVKPGKAAWSWPLLGDKSANFETQQRFIDYAAEMGWAYVLVDSWWDKQIGYDKMKELAAYAAERHVSLVLWYNSAGDWNSVKMTPRDKLLTHESRIREFDRLKSMGIGGLKIDFFGGDGQPVIAYYHDILEDAAPYGFLINFHGATLPRGWQRTYPHLMTMEAVRGEEYITFAQKNADQEPSHAAMLPFARNVFDPMDFTPVVLAKLPGKVQRRTTGAFELALAVLFTSGIQHYAEIPDGLAKMPDYVKDFLKHVPSVWDDVRFIDGYPGKFVVLARKGEGRWYVAGINGEAEEKTLTLDLSSIPEGHSGQLIKDGNGQMFEREPVTLGAGRKLKVTLKARDGFVLVLE